MFFCSYFSLHFVWEERSNRFARVIARHLRASYAFHTLLQSQVVFCDEFVLLVASEQDRSIESAAASAHFALCRLALFFGFRVGRLALFFGFRVDRLCTSQRHESARGGVLAMAMVLEHARLMGNVRRIPSWLGRRRSRWRSAHAIPDARQ